MSPSDLPGEITSDECSDAPENKRNQPLACAADAFVRLVVDIELPGDKEEIITDAMQQDAAEDESRLH